RPRTASTPHTGLDWDDDEIFDELLAAVPQGKTATDVHSPFNTASAEKTVRIVEDMTNVAPVMASMATAHVVKNSALQADLDDLGDLLIEEEEPSQPVRSSSYAQSSAFVQAPIQHQGIEQPASPPSATHAAVREALSKEEFVEAWQETAGKPQDEDAFEVDTRLTDASGRPWSRAMQVAERRKDLAPLPALALRDEAGANTKANLTEEQPARLSGLRAITQPEFNGKAKVVEA